MVSSSDEGHDEEEREEHEIVFHQQHTRMTPEQRRIMRQSKMIDDTLVEEDAAARDGFTQAVVHSEEELRHLEEADRDFAAALASREDDMLKFVAQVNKVYEERMKKPAPFMTFVFCGMQSAGKSTIVERFLGSVLNIVQEGTGTRCPLDATCIHDESVLEPMCELFGEELPAESKGTNLTVSKVFEHITDHNKRLASEDRFSVKPINLVYRSKDVQNMRFVDTPGIILNETNGKDNREEIKTILRIEMRKPNTKICVLFGPEEFVNVKIIEFCDQTFHGRNKWISDATFLMTKFDRKMDDSQTGQKANAFFQQFFDNECFPYLVISPTLKRENNTGDQLYEERCRLLEQADTYEKEKFEIWQEGHRQELAAALPGTDEPLDDNIKKRMGFPATKQAMREIMLKDTVARIPEVLASLRADLEQCEQEKQTLEDRKKLASPDHLLHIVNLLVSQLSRRIVDYLNGDLGVASKFPNKLQTLEEEVQDEENSDWKNKRLDHHSEREDEWRDRIALLKTYPAHLSAERNSLEANNTTERSSFIER